MQRDRETDTGTETQTEKQRDRATDRLRAGHRYRETERQRDRETERGGLPRPLHDSPIIILFRAVVVAALFLLRL
eukprot:COSAG03_NODE_8609_length_787_cov_27.318314_2_plen_74_part_01